MDYKNMMDFRGKSVLITGGTGGIGGELARAFASCGAKVAITGRNMEAAKAVLADCRALNSEACFVSCDLLNTKSIPVMVAECADRLGGIDILCNHAGFNNRKPALEYTESEWDKLLDVDLKAVFFTAAAVARRMVDNGVRGKIINTASVSSARGHKNLAAYAAAKGGIRQLTKVLAHEWAEYGINVNAVAPGYVVTAQTERYLSNEAARDRLLSRIPLGRFGTPGDVAATVLFLASEGASYITGQTIFVEGGRLID